MIRMLTGRRRTDYVSTSCKENELTIVVCCFKESSHPEQEEDLSKTTPEGLRCFALAICGLMTFPFRKKAVLTGVRFVSVGGTL